MVGVASERLRRAEAVASLSTETFGLTMVT